ncbi:MAG: hypothetical protein AAF682_30895 [Planctomycetota bacterium]
MPRPPRHRLRLRPAASAALLLLTPAAWAQQSESAADCAAEPVQIAYGQHASCALSGATDTDTLDFQGLTGERVRIVLDAVSGNLDPCLRLLDPLGAWVDLGAGPGGDYCCISGCTLVADLSLGETGTYRMLVSDWGSDEGGSYLLQLERLPPVSSPPPALIYNVTASDALDHSTDVDFFAFAATAGDLMQLTVDAVSGNLDPCLEILGPSGALLDLGGSTALCCISGCAIQHTWTVAETGTHTVVLADWGNDEGGSYDLTLQCLFGTCPPPPFQPYGLGLAGTGGIVPELTGSGVAALGGSVTLQVSGGAPGAVGLLGASPSEAFLPIFGGAVLIFPFAIVTPLTLDGGGAGAHTYPVPATPPLVGEAFFLQAGFLDAGAPEGVSLSQGLKLTVI